MIRAALQQYFKGLEESLEIIDDFSVGQEIEKILNSKKEKINDQHELAELIAFQFTPEYTKQEEGWGTYYGPMFILKNKEGQFVEFPSIKQINEEIIKYWEGRAKLIKHPLLALRYADLATEFGHKILGKFNHETAQKAIDATIEVCTKGLTDGLYCQIKLERALSLAVLLKDEKRLEKLKLAIISTEKKYAEDDKPGLWGFSFKWLLITYANKITLSNDEKELLINELEERLTRLTSVKDPDPWLVENVVLLLAKYYKKIGEEKLLQEVLSKLETAFKNNKYANSDGLLINNYLQKLVDVYTEYSEFEFARVAKANIISRISTLGKDASFQTHKISVETTITNAQIKKVIDSIFQENDVHKTIMRIAVNFVVRKNHVENDLKNISKKHPIQFLVTNSIMSQDGYTTVKFGSISEDYSQHLIKHFSQNITFQSPFLNLIFEELKKRYQPNEVKEALILSPAFRAEDGDYILKILEALWSNNYLVASCLSIPLIEDSIRNLYRVNNQPFIRTNDSGGYDVQYLDKLLSKGLINTIYGNLGVDMEFYFRVLLTERIGWNLRNNFAHGISKTEFFREDVAYRLAHILMCLGLLKLQETKT